MQIDTFFNTALGKFVILGAVIVIAVGAVLGWQYYNSSAKFISIAKIPPSTEYNLKDTANQAAYERLQQAYVALGKLKGQNLAVASVIDPAISRANAFLELGDTGRAILAYQWLNKYRPAGLQGFANLANLYVKIGEYNKAEQNYLIAIRNTKGLHIEPYEGLFNLYQGHMRDKLPQIEKILADGMAQAAAQGGKVSPNFRILLAQYYESAGRTGDAILQYQEVLKNDPGNTAIKAKIKELGGS